MPLIDINDQKVKARKLPEGNIQLIKLDREGQEIGELEDGRYQFKLPEHMYYSSPRIPNKEMAERIAQILSERSLEEMIISVDGIGIPHDYKGKEVK